MENPIKIDDLVVSLFLETPMLSIKRIPFFLIAVITVLQKRYFQVCQVRVFEHSTTSVKPELIGFWDGPTQISRRVVSVSTNRLGWV